MKKQRRIIPHWLLTDDVEQIIYLVSKITKKMKLEEKINFYIKLIKRLNTETAKLRILQLKDLNNKG